MNNEVVILVVEDDEGHAELIRRNLSRAGIVNKIINFRDGEEILNYLLMRGNGPHRTKCTPHVLLLDIRMPKIDGTEVLKIVKSDPDLQKMPVIMITTTDDPIEIDYCHKLGCNSYITKPVEYDAFVNAVRQLGLFLSIVEVPKIDKCK